ncbi:hypothetical protein FB451DRAFT_1190890 [Mycena latifolia]|nr:hypothetical protein FB451DRAFT_1190890 [Mycena latifolia]
MCHNGPADMPTSQLGFLPSRNGLTTTVQWSRSPSSPILCATALCPCTLPDRPAQTCDLTNHHDAKVRWECLLDHRPGRPIPKYSLLRTFRSEEALESMSRMALSVAYALTPPGITMDSPKGSSSQKAVRQFAFHYLPETVGPCFSPSSSHNARPEGGRGKGIKGRWERTQ